MDCYDLTRPVEAGMPAYPGDPPVECEPWATHDGDGYRVARLSLGSHAGTHVDAPAHTEPDPAGVAGDAYEIDDYPVEAFRFRAGLADLTGLDARAAVRPADLPPPGATDGLDLLVLHTGWGRHWGTGRYRDHPFLDRRAAADLAARGLAVGVDAWSVDPTPSPAAGDGEPDGVPAHHELLGAGRPVVENLANLADLAAALDDGEPFALGAYPLPVAGGDGAPARAVALLD